MCVHVCVFSVYVRVYVFVCLNMCGCINVRVYVCMYMALCMCVDVLAVGFGTGLMAVTVCYPPKAGFSFCFNKLSL